MSAALIDADHLADLTTVLGQGQVTLLTRALVAELTVAPGRIAASIVAGDAAGVRAAAHGLRGAAAGLGCACVANIAGRLEVEPLSRSLADLLAGRSERTIDALSGTFAASDLDPA